MEPILFLVHRIPFPPNKGDKIRSFHLLRHLAERYRVHLGTFVDMPEDQAHVPELDRLCASHRVELLDQRTARLRSMSGFLTGEALTLPYYRNAALQAWVRETVVRHGIRNAVVFSAAMAQYVRDIPDLRVVLDMVDVDSAKWTQYAERHGWPSSVVYRREGRKLLSFERGAALQSTACVFVTPGEADLFRRSAPDCGSKVHVIQNGVRTDHFCPDPSLPSPYAADEVPVVFTGAMDYWPNIDAVSWFAREVLPTVRATCPQARFTIVGMNPTSTVCELAALPGVVVTGRVDDVRPFLQHARVVVAPLRVARGIQNKVLEAMSMGRPVVASAAAASGVSAKVGAELASAAEPQEFAQKVLTLFEPGAAERMGLAARARVLTDYSWSSNLSGFDRLIENADIGSGAIRRAGL
jgi:sugar transferase (PEP-CTERM/EpsH1 system associated)